jgi:hypothetical protein
MINSCDRVEPLAFQKIPTNQNKTKQNTDDKEKRNEITMTSLRWVISPYDHPFFFFFKFIPNRPTDRHHQYRPFLSPSNLKTLSKRKKKKRKIGNNPTKHTFPFTSPLTTPNTPSP